MIMNKMRNNSEDIQALARTERLAYLRQWRAKNKDKVKESNARYWKKRAEKKLTETKKLQG